MPRRGPRDGSQISARVLGGEEAWGFVWTYKEGAAAGEERRDELELERRPVRFGLEDSGSVWG